MRNPGGAEQRAIFLRIANAVEWLGIVWIFSCCGYALLQFEWNQNLSDAIADATPLILLGGIGFATTFFVAWALAVCAGR